MNDRESVHERCDRMRREFEDERRAARRMLRFLGAALLVWIAVVVGVVIGLVAQLIEWWTSL